MFQQVILRRCLDLHIDWIGRHSIHSIADLDRQGTDPPIAPSYLDAVRALTAEVLWWVDMCILEEGWDVEDSYTLHREEQPRYMEFCNGPCDGQEQREGQHREHCGQHLLQITWPRRQNRWSLLSLVGEVSLSHALDFVRFTAWSKICWAENTVEQEIQISGVSQGWSLDTGAGHAE